MLPFVVEAFVSAPTPVRETLLAEAAIVGAGWSTGGWCASAIGLGPTGQRPTRLIVLSGASRDGDQVTHIARHELGHAWCGAPPQPYSQAVTARGEAAAFTMARPEGWACLPHVEAAHAREELIAEALAMVWGRR